MRAGPSHYSRDFQFHESIFSTSTECTSIFFFVQMANSDGACIFGTACFLLSSLAYLVAIGVGWAVDQNDRDGGSIRAGIIIVTLPVFAVFFYCVCSSYCGESSNFTRCAECCAFWTVLLAGVLELIGGILLIVAGTQANPGYKASGIVAGVFSIIAALSCCCSTVAVCGSTGTHSDSAGMDDAPKMSAEEDML